jgi:hypothetical protein
VKEKWARHWITPLFLLPFALLLTIHRILGLSDAMMVKPRAGETFWPLYNILMILSFWGGVSAFVAHTCMMFRYSAAWAMAKLLCLAIAWTTLILLWMRAS